MSTRSDISDPLLSVLRRIKKGHIRVDLNPAFRVLQTVHDKIRIGHRRYLFDIEKCLKRVHGGESPSDEEMTRAMDVYNKYVNKFILEESVQLKTVRNARDQKHHVLKDGGNMKTQHALSDNSDQVPGKKSGDRKSSDLLSDLSTVLQDQSHVTNASNPEAKDAQTTFGHENMILQKSTANDVSTMPQPVLRKLYELIGALEKYEHLKLYTLPPRQLVKEADEDYRTLLETIPQPDRQDKYALSMILNFAKDGQFLSAKRHCKQAREEINELSKTMMVKSKQTQQAIYETDQMPDIYLGTSLSAQQERHVSSPPNRTDHQNAQQQQRYGRGTQSLTNPVPARHDKNSMATSAKPGAVDIQTTRSHDNQQQKTKRKDGQSLDKMIRHNNPDIVDLSDENRPTKLAERYSELYDNQWTDASEELTVQGNKTKEQAIEILRKIIENAYKFSKEEAQKIIEKLATGLTRTIKEGRFPEPDDQTSDAFPNRSPESHYRLVKMRTLHAAKLLSDIQKEFKRTYIYKNITNGLKTQEALNIYSDLAVELTWWMNVLDPPVAMHFAKDYTFNTSLYKAYMKTGDRVAFYVWPALFLYETKEKAGPVLAKGVAQGCN